MSNNPTLLQQFRSFCFQNNIADLEKAIEYFCVFGGMGWKVDVTKSVEQLIEEKVLKNYRYIHGDITKITQSNNTHHALLTAIATGDRREHSAFKKANVRRETGEESIDFLIEHKLIHFDKSIEKPVDEKDANSDKLLFNQPFMRFWFSCISPYYKGIRDGDYKEFMGYWKETKITFSHLIYTQLVMELIKQSFKEEPSGGYISSIGSYWDKHTNIDILAKRKSGKTVAGLCKYTKAKAGKSELTKLKEQCKQAELDVEIFVIFSKNKFSSELKKEKSHNVLLLTPRNLQILLSDLSEDDLLVHTNKRY
ncbi:MAG: DUF234 domain-containing protein [Campylobacterota bacterium]|nr:DUF234 domain-containing protein [Campylobacterota bacterium]